MTYDLHCRYCNALLHLTPAADCPPDWAERLAKMVVCNWCADAIHYKGDWFDTITRIMVKLCRHHRLLLVKKQSPLTVENLTELGDNLYEAMRRYGEAQARLLHVPMMPFTRLHSDPLLREPWKWEDYLKDYLDTIRVVGNAEKRKAAKQPELRVTAPDA